MSYDGNSAEHQPLTPLNTTNGRGLKSHKAVKSFKEIKPAMELCEIKLDEVMDAELAGRLTATAIEQFLFFMNQVPYPVSRLSRLPAANEKTQRLRNDFMTAQKKLLQDIKSAISAPQEVSNVEIPPPLRIVITLGSIMMPKAAMLFQVPAVRTESAKSNANTRNSSSGSNAWSEELPPDSDSDEPDDNDAPNSPIPSQAVTKRTIPTDEAISSFTPFHDEVPIGGLIDSTLPTSTPTLRKPLSPRPNGLSKPSQIDNALDENRTSKARLDKRFRTAERDLTMAISSLDVFTDEMELSKIHVYLQAPRASELDGWHPRPSVIKALDAMANFPQIEVSARTKLAKMNAFAVKVHLKNGEATDSSREDADAGEHVWLEWDGKLTGVE